MGEVKGRGDPKVHASDIARRQYGVISRDQLRETGLTEDEIRGWIERRHLHRLHRGVYAVGHTRLIDHARLIAALLACGPKSFLSHRTAAAVWGLRVVALKALEVTVPGGARRSRLIVHRTGDTADVTTRNGLRVSSVPRLLVELAPREKPAELDRLITEAVRRNILSLEHMEEVLARCKRWPGMRKLRAALKDYRPQPERASGLERAFDRLIAGTDILPPQKNVWLHGWEIDCYWPEHALAIELDGGNYHRAVKDMEKDKLKDLRLAQHGILVVRITDTRMELEPATVRQDVRGLLQLR